MSTPFKDHVSALLKPLIDELITAFCGFSRLTTSGQEDSAFFVLHRHEVGRYFYVHNIRTVAVRAEVVHEEIVRIVNEKVKSVDHLAVVANQRHLDRLVNYFLYGGLCALLLLEELYRHLLFRFFQQKFGLSDNLFTLLQSFLNLASLLQDTYIVSIGEILLLLLKKFSTDIGSLVKFLGLELHINEVGVFE